MRRIAFPLILAGTFAVAALGAHAAGSSAPARVVDVSHDDGAVETPSPAATPGAPDDPDGRVASASPAPDAPDDSDGRADDDHHGGRGHDEDDDDRSGSNSGKG